MIDKTDALYRALRDNVLDTHTIYGEEWGIIDLSDFSPPSGIGPKMLRRRLTVLEADGLYATDNDRFGLVLMRRPRSLYG